MRPTGPWGRAAAGWTAVGMRIAFRFAGRCRSRFRGFGHRRGRCLGDGAGRRRDSGRLWCGGRRRRHLHYRLGRGCRHDERLRLRFDRRGDDRLGRGRCCRRGRRRGWCRRSDGQGLGRRGRSRMRRHVAFDRRRRRAGSDGADEPRRPDGRGDRLRRRLGRARRGLLGAAGLGGRRCGLEEHLRRRRQGDAALAGMPLDELASHDLFDRARRALHVDAVITLQERDHFLARRVEQLRDFVNPDG